MMKFLLYFAIYAVVTLVCLFGFHQPMPQAVIAGLIASFGVFAALRFMRW